MNLYKIYREVIYKCGDEEEFTIYSENMVVLVPNSLTASKIYNDDKSDFRIDTNEPYKSYGVETDQMLYYYRDIDNNDADYLRTECRVTFVCAEKLPTKMQIIHTSKDNIF